MTEIKFTAIVTAVCAVILIAFVAAHVYAQQPQADPVMAQVDTDYQGLQIAQQHLVNSVRALADEVRTTQATLTAERAYWASWVAGEESKHEAAKK